MVEAEQAGHDDRHVNRQRQVDHQVHRGFAQYDHSVPTVHAYETVENGGVWEEGDARKEASLRYDFSYNGVEPDLSSLTWEGLSEEDHDELKPHIKKYEDFRTDVASGLEVNNMWLSGKNIPVLRYADVLLCYAECLNELGQTANTLWLFKVFSRIVC